MPAPYGLTTAGLSVRRQDEIIAELQAAIAADGALGNNLNTATESSLGQLLRIFAASLAQANELAEQVHSAWNPNTAFGVDLDQLVRLRGIAARAAATQSSVTLPLQGTSGTVIPVGTAVTLDGSGSRWTIDPAVAPVTIGSGGSISANFLADSTGPIAALANSTWSIATPVSGFTSVGPNTADATLGRDVETDGELRVRFLSSVGSAPGASPDSIRTGVFGVSGVTEAIVIENRNLIPDLDGRPGKSFEVVARGGDDQAIANAIWAGKSAGSESATTVGVSNQVIKSVVDASGNNQTVSFSRPDLIPVWVEVDYTPRTTAPTDVETRIQQAILDFDASIEIGQDVGPVDIEQAILCYSGLAGVFTSLTLRMGLSASPPIAQSVPASLTQLPDFDSARITIARV